MINHQKIVGSQYWSLTALSTRGVVSSGFGVDRGVKTSAINRLTVTNYSDPSGRASLVTDLLTRRCEFYPVEGGSAYGGYDYYRNFIQSAAAAGIPVNQTNTSDFVRSGMSFGPANSWAATPPTGDPKRVLTYTVTFKAGTNEMIAYETAGIEELPNARGEMEPVNLVQSEIRTDYSDVDSFPDGFFDTSSACFFESAPSPPPPSPTPLSRLKGITLGLGIASLITSILVPIALAACLVFTWWRCNALRRAQPTGNLLGNACRKSHQDHKRDRSIKHIEVTSNFGEVGSEPSDHRISSAVLHD